MGSDTMTRLLFKGLFLAAVSFALGGAAPAQEAMTIEKVQAGVAQATGHMAAPWLPGHEGGNR